MLRLGLLVFGVALAVVGLVLAASGGGWQVAIFGAILVIAVLCERWRYRGIEAPLRGRWQRTGERFEDPGTGKIVEVLYDVESGERRYAPAPGKPPKTEN